MLASYAEMQQASFRFQFQSSKVCPLAKHSVSSLFSFSQARWVWLPAQKPNMGGSQSSELTHTSPRLLSLPMEDTELFSEPASPCTSCLEAAPAQPGPNTGGLSSQSLWATQGLARRKCMSELLGQRGAGFQTHPIPSQLQHICQRCR
jgi:hypothetical protein